MLKKGWGGNVNEVLKQYFPLLVTKVKQIHTACQGQRALMLAMRSRFRV